MRENLDFVRRSWRHHSVLSAVQLACALGVGVVGILRLTSHDQWLTGLWLAFLAGAFVCWVLLVRQDED
jgi:hypothetical protein